MKRKRSRLAASVMLASSLLAPSAWAGGVEVGLNAGFRFGSASFPIEASGPLILCFATPCVLAQASTDDGELTPTLIVDVPIAGPWMLEALVTELDGDLELRSDFPPGDLERETHESETLLVGLLREFGDGARRPFLAAALGVTRFRTSAHAYETPLLPGAIAATVDEEVLAASLAGGVKWDLGRSWLARMEVRAFFHDLPDRAGGTHQQGELSVGLAYRF